MWVKSLEACRGELLGGCDIVMELKQAGELRDTIEEMKARLG